jgi:hypothetical protein
MESGKRIVAAALLFTLVAAAGCATSPYPQLPPPAAAPIAVAGRTLTTVAVRTVFADVPGGRIIGYHHDGADLVRGQGYKWDRAFENEAEELNDLAFAVLQAGGYPLAPLDAAPDRPDVVYLDAALGKLAYNSYSHRDSFNQAGTEVRWSLFRAGDKKPFFTATTFGSGRKPDDNPGAVVAAFEMALRSLMADMAFVEALQRDR